MEVKADGAWVPIQDSFRTINIRTVTSSSSLQTTDAVLLVNATDAAVTITLPDATTMPGREVNIKNVVIPVQKDDIIELHYRHLNDVNSSRGQARGLQLLSGPIDNSGFITENFVTVTS